MTSRAYALWEIETFKLILDPVKETVNLTFSRAKKRFKFFLNLTHFYVNFVDPAPLDWTKHLSAGKVRGAQTNEKTRKWYLQKSVS